MKIQCSWLFGSNYSRMMLFLAMLFVLTFCCSIVNNLYLTYAYGQIDKPIHNSTNFKPTNLINSSSNSEIKDYSDFIPLLFNQIKDSVVQITKPPDSDIEQPISSRIGSGFLYDYFGHIVTNYHVVNAAKDDKVFVSFLDGKNYEAKIIGVDPYADLAVIKLTDAFENTQGYMLPLKLSNSSETQIGERVIAVGNPFGLSGSISEGVVSGVGRLMPSGDFNKSPDTPIIDGLSISKPSFSIPDIIQTDAAINPGNSGGPLINMKGEVIGINTAIFSNTGGYSGIGFAVPSKFIIKIVPSLIETGIYEHPYIGINGFDITPEISNKITTFGTLGFLVVSVTPGSPAELSGVKGGNVSTSIGGKPVTIGGDIIIRIDDNEVRKIDDILSYLENHKKIGESVSLTILRGTEQKEIEINVTLVSRPMFNLNFKTPSLGVIGLDLNKEIASFMNITRENGFIITDIISNSSSSKADLRGGNIIKEIDSLPIQIGGDVIIRIDDKNIENQKDIAEFLQTKKLGDSVVITIIRDGKQISKSLILDNSHVNYYSLMENKEESEKNPFLYILPKETLEKFINHCYKILSKNDCIALLS